MRGIIMAVIAVLLVSSANATPKERATPEECEKKQTEFINEAVKLPPKTSLNDIEVEDKLYRKYRLELVETMGCDEDWWWPAVMEVQFLREEAEESGE